MMRLAIAIGVLILTCGCGLLPRPVQQPMIHNPFPQLTKVAVAPFFNLSTEPTVDGRQFGEAYFGELQKIPGFEVVPVGVVEKAAEANGIQLNNPDQVRQLAKMLGVDAVVIGAVTDWSMYYPPRCGLQVEWYAANPCFHPVPTGYGLPWGTTEEELIPPSLVLEAEMALAREQLKTQTPAQPLAVLPGVPQGTRPGSGSVIPAAAAVAAPAALAGAALADSNAGIAGEELPPDWPDPRGFIPPPPSPHRPPCQPSNEPVLRHARIYFGNDSEFTAALENHHYFQSEARRDGWQGYLQRSSDFISFCCYKHIAEMLTARGGAGESRVVYRWEKDR